VHATADGDALYRASIAAGFEGIMAKRKASIYHAGRRSDEWLKIKHVQTAEFVIGGHTEGKGARRDQFGALVLGVWEDDKLRAVGNVGSGFDDATLAQLTELLKTKRTAKMPFDVKPEAEGKILWTKPELVAEVQFAGWTDAGLSARPGLLEAAQRYRSQVGDARARSTAVNAPPAQPTRPRSDPLAACGYDQQSDARGQRPAHRLDPSRQGPVACA